MKRSASNNFFFATDQGWGDASDNILTVPWKPTSNGFEPSRNFPGNSQYGEMWNPSSKVQGSCAYNRLIKVENSQYNEYGTKIA